MVFILYKLYILFPYKNPTPKSSLHRKLSAFLHLKNKQTSFCIIYKLFSSWDLNLGPHGDTSPHVCIQVPTRIKTKQTHTHWVYMFYEDFS